MNKLRNYYVIGPCGQKTSIAIELDMSELPLTDFQIDSLGTLKIRQFTLRIDFGLNSK